MNNELRIIISGGGTGGHIFPAVSIANAIKAKRPDAKILFVGALGRMEMQRVPAAGYEIKGLPICGFDRKHLLKNIAVLFKIWKSQHMAKSIIKNFKPMAAVGVGGYASGPTLNVCASKGIPCLIQEQNSYAGVTNKLLAKKAEKICVAYEGMERFFPADKIIMTGNPVRQNVLETTITKEEARKQFGLDPEKKTILLVGGSLGARTINESVLQHLDLVKESGVQFLVVCGNNKKMLYHVEQFAAHYQGSCRIYPYGFVHNVEVMMSASDCIVSKPGGLTVSEALAKTLPMLLFDPIPGHEERNVDFLVNNGMAALITKHFPIDEAVYELFCNPVRLETVRRTMSEIAHPDATERLAEFVLRKR